MVRALLGVLRGVLQMKAGPRGRAQVYQRRSRDTAVAAQYDVPGAAAGYADAHEGSGPTARFFRARMDLVSRTLAAVPGGDLLDAGCGPGMMTRELLDSRPGDFRITVLDRSLDMVRASARRAEPAGGVHALVGRVEAMPFPDAGFDVVLALGVLEYAESAAALAEMARIVRPGGVVLATMLNPMSPYRFVEWYAYWPLLRVVYAVETVLKVAPERRHRPIATGIRTYRARSLRAMMVAAGLRPVSVTYFDVTFLVPPLDRVVRRWSRGRTRPGRVPDLGWRNRLGTAYLVLARK